MSLHSSLAIIVFTDSILAKSKNCVNERAEFPQTYVPFLKSLRDSVTGTSV